MSVETLTPQVAKNPVALPRKRRGWILACLILVVMIGFGYGHYKNLRQEIAALLEAKPPAVVPGTERPAYSISGTYVIGPTEIAEAVGLKCKIEILEGARCEFTRGSVVGEAVWVPERNCFMTNWGPAYFFEDSRVVAFGNDREFWRRE